MNPASIAPSPSPPPAQQTPPKRSISKQRTEQQVAIQMMLGDPAKGIQPISINKTAKYLNRPRQTVQKW